MAAPAVEAPGTSRRPSPDRGRLVAGLALGAMAVVAFGIRLVHITDAPLNFQPARQYFDALIARNYAVGNGGAYPSQLQALSQHVRPQLIEPPITQALTAAVWWARGTQDVWVGEVWSCLFWVVGGVLVYFVGRRLAGRAAGLAAAAFFLFDPVALVASRSFQPDPLMVAAVAGATLALMVDDERQTWRSAVVAVAAGAFALLAKQVGAFFVLPVLAGLAFQRGGWRGVVSRRTLLMAGGVVAPVVLYTAYGTWINPFLGSQEGGRFVVHLWFTAGYWRGWYDLATAMVGTLALLISLAGLGLVKGRSRMVLGALFVGYVLYGLSFTYSFETSIYYHLPVLLPVSLGLGVVVGHLFGRVRATWPSPRLIEVGLLAAVGLVLVATVFAGDAPLIPPRVSPAVQARVIDSSRAVGAITHHDQKSILLAPADAQPLRFYGLVTGADWLTNYDTQAEVLTGGSVSSVAQELQTDDRDLGGAHYFVITDMAELAAQPQLRAYLDQHYPLVASSSTYRIYDLRHPKAGS